MKEKIKKQGIILMLLAIILIAGIVVILTLGFNFELNMQETKRVELYLEKNFEISDIRNITNEVIPNQNIIIQKVEVFEDSVSIKAKDITEEQKQTLVEKVNEKYGTALTADNIEIETIPSTRGRDLLKPYIAPFTIASILILGYIAIRYKKIGSIKTLIKVGLVMIISQALLFSIIAITRIPIGRLTIPMVIIVYVFTLLGMTTRLEKELVEKNEANKKNQKA